ncbi:MAG TPA: hypothetical protein EYP21_10945 [Syntrophaceae bacterium]|nr:hypothetical protein [Syntrophaceae bacterium]
MKKLVLILALCSILISSLCFAGGFEFGTMTDSQGNIYHWDSFRIGRFEFGTMYDYRGNIYHWDSYRIGRFEFGSMRDSYGNTWSFDSFRYGPGCNLYPRDYGLDY